MANLKEVKGRIQSVVSTQQITKAMKMVAAAKLRRAQDSITQMRPYAQKLNSMLQNLSSQGGDDEQGKFSEVRQVEKVLLIAVTSDKGLCGAFNSNVFKAVNRTIKEKYQRQFSNDNVTILTIGKKARDYFTKRNYKVVTDYWDMFSPVSFEKSTEAAEYAMNSFVDGKYDKVEIIYNEFKNVATQIMRVEQFLPVVPSEEIGSSLFQVDYIFQPSREEIVRDLIPKSLKIQVFKAILDSNAAEHGARMTAMDQATDNAGELLKELRLTYNRTRQAAITKEILEIVAGAEALG
ncbi:ATP synthase gamma chain [Fulvivirga imtechensis AK7]|uniref:ATP synthase gamma chain n=1 Tax=Fulvivirga imtechensis AK7 TaxID=1237149 RepID=L8JNZ2_9BACT|nr:ATP synthase F1 subunit gamma [Fulvivirga imtechensis]ELR69903.1 ATP synthase gamma chain [Fulvivirga imtechensis AK7]